ncbi:MAG: hypothetical protein HAW66_09985 [Shewanella sp.]|nr:hypothetical protein [Shewanella sp.]
MIKLMFYFVMIAILIFATGKGIGMNVFKSIDEMHFSISWLGCAMSCIYFVFAFIGQVSRLKSPDEG